MTLTVDALSRQPFAFGGHQRDLLFEFPLAGQRQRVLAPQVLQLLPAFLQLARLIAGGSAAVMGDLVAQGLE